MTVFTGVVGTGTLSSPSFFSIAGFNPIELGVSFCKFQEWAAICWTNTATKMAAAAWLSSWSPSSQLR
jgi:hypothetical protein